MTNPMASPEVRRHFARETRRNMAKLARSLGIDPADFPDPLDLWRTIGTVISAGVPSPRHKIPGDPFAVFVTRECPTCGPQTMVVPTPDGGPVDEETRDDMIRYVLAKEPVCREDGESMPGNYSADMTRMSVFADRGRKVAIG